MAILDLCLLYDGCVPSNRLPLRLNRRYSGRPPMSNSRPAAEKRALVRHLSPEMVALATPDDLVRLLDLDLWHAAQPGGDETFDAARFGVWLEVLLDAGPSVAAQKLAEINVELVVAGLSHHVRVLDRAAGVRLDDCLTADIAGYVVAARRTDAWDVVVAVLMALEAEQPDRFHRLMSGARALSNSAPEIDGLDDLLGDGDQLMYDVSLDREQRREDQGYVAVSDARAFLQAARDTRFQAGAPEPASAAREFGLQPRMPRLGWIRGQMQFLADRDSEAYLARNGDLAYLANTLIAGCSIQGRAFSVREARDAAAAVCNLGLERLAAPPGFLADHDLMSVFQAGWTVLHDDVVMYAADQLSEALADLRCRDREIRADLDALRHELVTRLRTGAPWLARPRMDVLASLDMLAWTALLGLIDECPVLHAAIAASREPTTHTVSASAFEFISEKTQIQQVRAFVQALGEILRD